MRCALRIALYLFAMNSEPILDEFTHLKKKNNELEFDVSLKHY